LSAHHKLSILYYLLLDHDSVAGSRAQQLAEQFATTSGLPRKYQILMKGLWYMDHQQFTVSAGMLPLFPPPSQCADLSIRAIPSPANGQSVQFALEHLTHPSLTPEFADEIVTTLVRHASHDGDFTLPLAYYHTVHPVLRSADTLRLLFGALARTSVTEALYFSRPYPEPARRALFEHLVGSVLDGGLHASQGAGPRSSRDGGMTGRAPGRREELVGMAFDEEEERWFREFLTSGEGRSSKDARPILAARRALHSGIGSL
jgi:hypothetical protein